MMSLRGFLFVCLFVCRTLGKEWKKRNACQWNGKKNKKKRGEGKKLLRCVGDNRVSFHYGTTRAGISMHYFQAGKKPDMQNQRQGGTRENFLYTHRGACLNRRPPREL